VDNKPVKESKKVVDFLDCQRVNRHHPAQLASQVTILSLGEDTLERLPVRQSSRFGPSGGLREFLLQRRQWKAGFNSANGIDIAGHCGCPSSREMHPAVERGCPFFAAGTRFDAHRVRDFPNRIAKAYLLIFDKAGEANAMRLALDFAYWCILFLGVHGSLVSTVYPLASMTW